MMLNIFLLIISLIFSTLDEGWKEKEIYLSRYLLEVHQKKLDENSSYRIIILYCQNCGNCDSKLNLKSNFFAPDKINIIIQVNAHPVYEILVKNKKLEVYLDENNLISKYGFAGTYNKLYVMKGHKILEEKEL